MVARRIETANDFKTKSNYFCKDCIAGVIHPKDTPFYWLGAIVENPERYADICLFRQHGTTLSIIYPVKNPPKITGKPRISKGTDDVAVISQSYLKFVMLDYFEVEKCDKMPSVSFEDGMHMMDPIIVKWITFVSIVFAFLLFM